MNWFSRSSLMLSLGFFGYIWFVEGFLLSFRFQGDIHCWFVEDFLLLFLVFFGDVSFIHSFTTGSDQLSGNGWEGWWLPHARTWRGREVEKKVQKSAQNNQNQQKLERVFRSPNAKTVSCRFCSRDMPPPPPQFDDPPPAAGLEQFVRGRKCFFNFYFPLSQNHWQESTQHWQHWTQRAMEAATRFAPLHLATRCLIFFFFCIIYMYSYIYPSCFQPGSYRYII